MPMHFFAFIPYAAVGYCVAKAAHDVWPTLRSQLGIASRYSSRAGMDGEHTRARAYAQCPPGAARNQASSMSPMTVAALAARPVVADYCYDERSGTIKGDGPLAGAEIPSTAVALYEENGERYAHIAMGGDATMDVPVCERMGFVAVPYDPGVTGVPVQPTPTVPTPPTAPPPPGEPPTMGPPMGVPPYTPPEVPEDCVDPGTPYTGPGCPPRYQEPRGEPHWRHAEPCPPWRRNQDPYRLHRKRMRWG